MAETHFRECLLIVNAMYYAV